MPMYTITELCDGRLVCRYRLQDSTEEFFATDPAAAVESLVNAARIGNGDRIGPDDIQWCREEERVERRVVAVPIERPSVQPPVHPSSSLGSQEAGGPAGGEDVGVAKTEADPAWKARLKEWLCRTIDNL